MAEKLCIYVKVVWFGGIDGDLGGDHVFEGCYEAGGDFLDLACRNTCLLSDGDYRSQTLCRG